MKSKKCFTLIELLVVVAIIAVLVAILLPALNNARQQALNIQCQARLSNLAQAAIAYSMDYNKFPPPNEHVLGLSYPQHWYRWFQFLFWDNYLPGPLSEGSKYFTCSVPNYNRYAMVTEVYGPNPSAIPDPTKCALFCDGANDSQINFWVPFAHFVANSNRHKGGINVAYCDGHVSWHEGVMPVYACPPDLTTLDLSVWLGWQMSH